MKRVNSVWVALAVDPMDGSEGMCGVLIGDHWMPLVAADELRLPFVQQQARFIADRTGQTVRVIRLTTREEVETVSPAGISPR